jgi:hypothetical protein
MSGDGKQGFHVRAWALLVGAVAFLGILGGTLDKWIPIAEAFTCEHSGRWCADFSSAEVTEGFRQFFGAAGGSTPGNAYDMTSETYRSRTTSEEFDAIWKPVYWAEALRYEPVEGKRNTYTVHTAEYRGPLAEGAVELQHRTYEVEVSGEGARLIFFPSRTTTDPGSAPSPVKLVKWKQASATYSDPKLDSNEQLKASAGKVGHKENALCQIEGEPVDGSAWWTHTIVAWIPNAYLTVDGEQVPDLPVCEPLMTR